MKLGADNMDSGEADQWKYIWDNGHYSSSKAYKSMIGSKPIHPAFKWIWYSASQQKHKIFFGYCSRTGSIQGVY
jgi:hypothetical protein